MGNCGSRFSPLTWTHVEHYQVPGKINVSTASAQGWRMTMEDSHVVHMDEENNTLLLGVFDGHGGVGVARYVGHHLLEKLKSLDSYKRRDFEVALREAFLQVDADMLTEDGDKEVTLLSKLVDVYEAYNFFKSYELRFKEDFQIKQSAISNTPLTIQNAINNSEDPFNEIFQGIGLEKVKKTKYRGLYQIDNPNARQGTSPRLQGCAATVVLVDLETNTVFCANAGDSRTVAAISLTSIFDAENKEYFVTIPLSYDHKPNDPIEYARIQQAGGFVSYPGKFARVNDILSLSRAFGDFDLKCNEELPAEQQMVTVLPDVKQFALSKDVKSIILACDGIWEKNCTDNDLKKLIESDQCVLEQKLKKFVTGLIDPCGPNLETPIYRTGCDNMTIIVANLTDEYRESLLEYRSSNPSDC